MIARLLYGPFDAAVVTVKDDSQWLFFEYDGRPFMLTTRCAQWPHVEGPSRRPKGMAPPLLCYRLRRHNAEAGKAEFEFDDQWSDRIEEVPPGPDSPR